MRFSAAELEAVRPEDLLFYLGESDAGWRPGDHSVRSAEWILGEDSGISITIPDQSCRDYALRMADALSTLGQVEGVPEQEILDRVSWQSEPERTVAIFGLTFVYRRKTRKTSHGVRLLRRTLRVGGGRGWEWRGEATTSRWRP